MEKYACYRCTSMPAVFFFAAKWVSLKLSVFRKFHNFIFIRFIVEPLGDAYRQIQVHKYVVAIVQCECKFLKNVELSGDSLFLSFKCTCGGIQQSRAWLLLIFTRIFVAFSFLIEFFIVVLKVIAWWATSYSRNDGIELLFFFFFVGGVSQSYYLSMSIYHKEREKGAKMLVNE